MSNEKVFVIPRNDGEAVEIGKVLEQVPEAEVLTTAQTWGASWDNLEPEIKDAMQQAAAEGKEIYGVELQGKAPEGCENIDHHSYDGGKDDRSNPLSSLEQVAKLVNVELTKLRARRPAALAVG